MLNIVIVQGAFLPVPPIQGGAVEKIWFRMGQEFAAVGNKVTHISKTHADLPTVEMQHGVTYVRIKGYDTPKSLLILKLLDLFYSIHALFKIPSDADVIVTNTFWLPFLLRGKKGRKVYADVQRVPKGQMKFYTHIGRLRACSPAIEQAIRAELPVSSHSIVTYIPNPVPFDVPSTSTVKEKIILFVGRVHPEKGVDVLIKAYLDLSAEMRAQWKLVIVGPHEIKDGGGGDTYLKEVQELAAPAKVEILFTGPLFKEADLKEWYAKSTLFCYPAQDGSGDAAPVAPREAMAYGCVPIVSALPCFNDFIEDHKNGCIFDQASANQIASLTHIFEELIADPELTARLSKAAILVLKTYASQTIAQQFLNDFKTLIK
ncbi:glycosyltransferase family 4 protein [uncultured Cytophaga sp.]|uniref:glycosyltransferase family 4 protein n=1 Tax=uncultured Cytophaga sp. TaxID=160238 RepID=UPI002633BDD3|nr:glycosyltransferase family 4 protein [uncultured Cytophaga sp.]